ncbi:putative Activating signal cointegrator 1 complex subunit 1 [Blattamonas nauphoetae]|uniref:Activating signal cointegrator 1 complex subunit 1 n=1 Tax=Blattamonas nauphoetae TaxID=2049346 RepID=A0ABQ9Y669_9EUKA|nr:putative Activating signal cointegrator 1 complex subunit 1 [Blattamonas nauphoetae]
MSKMITSYTPSLPESSSTDGSQPDETPIEDPRFIEVRQIDPGQFELEMMFTDALKHDLSREINWKKQLENSTGCSIIDSSPVTEKHRLIVKGPSEQHVRRCGKSVSEMHDRLRKKLGFTHFFNIPLSICPGYIETLTSFKEQTLKLYQKAKGMDRSIFYPTQKHHFTLLMAQILSDEEEQTAIKILEDAQQEFNTIINGQPLHVHMIGLSAMQTNTSNANVVYVNVERTNAYNAVQEIAALLRERCKSHGIHVEEQRTDEPVKLHATFINTKFRRGGYRRGLDASKLIETNANTDFGEWVLPVLHLSRLGGSTRFLAKLPATPDDRLMRIPGFFDCVKEIRFCEEIPPSFPPPLFDIPQSDTDTQETPTEAPKEATSEMVEPAQNETQPVKDSSEDTPSEQEQK